MAKMKQTKNNFPNTMSYVKKIVKKIIYWFWILYGYVGRVQYIGTEQKVTVIIPSYSEKRTKNLEPLIRVLLKCKFAEKIIISNHNPQIVIEDRVKLRDGRLRLINQPLRRGCGYGWVVANENNPSYLISIDDDILVFPSQLAKLFLELIKNPEIPHGLSGRAGSKNYQLKEMEVDNLYEIYAVTGEHLRKYLDFVEAITDYGEVSSDDIEFWGDDILISQLGRGKSVIHKAGWVLLRCQTKGDPGVATHREAKFEQKRTEVQKTIERIRSSDPFKMKAPHNPARRRPGLQSEGKRREKSKKRIGQRCSKSSDAGSGMSI